MLARYCRIADESTGDSEAAEQFLQTIARLIQDCGMDKLPHPVKEEDIEELTHMIAKDSINYSAPMTFSNEDIRKVLGEVKS